MSLTFVLAVVFIAVALAIAALLVYLMKSVSQTAQRSVAPTPTIPQRPVPVITEFHVKGDTAKAVFQVPLGDGPIGEHLRDLLSASAVEYVRRKQAEGFPLDGVRRIEVSAMRGDAPEVVNVVELPETGELPDPRLQVLVELEHDPIAHVASVVADTTVATAPAPTKTLEPVSEFIELPPPVEAHLRSIGVDPAHMSLEDLVLGLLRLSGYEVTVGRTGFNIGSVEKADIFGLHRNGQKAVLVIIEHEVGTHPELDERVLAEFSVGVVQTNPDLAILVTDKYSPYSMYEREKRDKRLVFITRERLQAFVDSFAVS